MKSIHLLALFCYPTGRFPNNDGFDPESCINVTLVNSRIDVADDGICPKAAAGKGPLKGLYVHNVSVRHVHTKSQRNAPLLITLIYMFTAYLCGINLCIANQRQSRCVQALRTYTYARIRACGKCWRETPRMLTPHNDEQRRSHSHAIKFGSNTDTDMSDIVFDNITIWDSNGGLAIQQRSEGNTLPSKPCTKT